MSGDGRFVAQVLGWLFWFAATALIIKIDQRRRASAAQGSPAADEAAFEDKRVWPYILLGLLCGLLSLPVYFWSTRKKPAAIAIGVAWSLASGLVAGALGVACAIPIDGWARRSLLADRDADCRKGEAIQCVLLAQDYRTGHGPNVDPQRAAEYMFLACQGGEVEGCADAIKSFAGGEGVAKNDDHVEAAHKRGQELCKNGALGCAVYNF